MIARRQLTLSVPLLYIAASIQGVRAQGYLCASFTNGSFRYCDDRRASRGQGGPSPGPALSPSPWRTWNSEQLRQWDADVARWGSVSKQTYNSVQALAAGLPDVDPKTGERYTDLKAAISATLGSVAGDVINRTLPDNPEVERFWKQIASASNGWQRLQEVSKSQAIGQYTKITPNLETFLHPNGFIRSEVAGDPLAKVEFQSGQRPDAFQRSSINTLEFTRATLFDALEVAGAGYSRSVQQGSDALILVEILAIGSLANSNSLAPILTFTETVVNELADFFDGLATGAIQSAGVIIDFLVNLITSPIRTLSALADAIWPLDDFLVSLFNTVVADVKAFISGTAHERGEIVGNFVVAILTAELGAGALSRLGGTALGTRIGLAYTSLGDIYAAGWLAKRVSVTVEYVGQLRRSFDHELRAALRFGEASKSIPTSLQAKLLEAEILEGFSLYPSEAALPQQLKTLLQERRAVISETDRLVEEAANIAVNGRYSSLDEVRATIDRIALDSGLEGRAFQYADQRLATAFEQVKARQVNGTWDFYDPPKGSPGARQFDIKSDTELIQCSMKEFRTDNDVTSWFMSKGSQIDATAETAKRLGLESTYWFRWQPRTDVVDALKGRGIRNVRWDLPPR